MNNADTPLPEIVSKDEWLAAYKQLLEKGAYAAGAMRSTPDGAGCRCAGSIRTMSSTKGDPRGVECLGGRFSDLDWPPSGVTMTSTTKQPFITPKGGTITTSENTLKPAAELAGKNKIRFPNESDAYRQARQALLAEEIELRRHLARVAEQRGWRHLKLYSDSSGEFTRDYVSADDANVPGYTVFTRKDGSIRHFWSAEGGFEIADPGQDPHNAPDMNPLWIILDTTPEGRGTDWYPKLAYDR